MKKSRRILVSGGYARSLVNFRLPLLKSFRGRGFEVWTTAADEQPWITERLAGEGIEFRPAPVQRAGLNPLADWRYLRFLRKLVAEVQPEIVLGYTHKAAIYSSLAAGSARSFSLITGLGYAFMESRQALDPKRALARGVLCRLYKRALRRNELTFFQNEEDRDEFVRRKLVTTDASLRVMGTGVDVNHYGHDPLREQSGSIRLLCIARVLRDKGIREFAEALKILRSKEIDFEAHLVGRFDPNPAGIRPSEIDGWVKEKLFTYSPEQEDVRKLFEWCDVYVLPSYREGMPRTVLEALSIGRAVATTNVPGCRDTVSLLSDDASDGSGVPYRIGLNGGLVAARSALALAELLAFFSARREDLKEMGQASRRLAEEVFDIRKVNNVILKGMGLQ